MRFLKDQRQNQNLSFDNPTVTKAGLQRVKYVGLSFQVTLENYRIPLLLESINKYKTGGLLFYL